MQDLSQWVNPECPVEVEYLPHAMEAIRQEAVEGLVALRRGGISIGGLLLGDRVSEKRIRVVATEPIECSHALGPSFVLSANELQALRKRLAQPGPLGVVGLYVSKPKGDITLSEQQLAMFHDLFPEPFQVALLIRPGSLEPSFGVVYCQANGTLIKGLEREIRPWVPPGGPISLPKLRPDAPSARAFAARLPMAALESEYDGAPVRTPKPSITSKPETRPAGTTPAEMASSEISRAEISETETPPADASHPESPKADEGAGFTPSPISIKFDEKPSTPSSAPGEKVQTAVERFYLAVRRNVGRIVAVATVLLLLGGVVAAIHYTRPMWYTPPPANLTVAESKGTLTFRWNPASAEFVDAGTLSVTDGSERSTIVLTHRDLMNGRVDFIRTTGNVTASLALDDRRFLTSFHESEGKPANKGADKPGVPEKTTVPASPASALLAPPAVDAPEVPEEAPAAQTAPRRKKLSPLGRQRRVPDDR